MGRGNFLHSIHRPAQNNSSCAKGFSLLTNGLSRGRISNLPGNGWKSQLPLPESHSCISAGRSNAGMRSWIGDINGEAPVVIIE